MSEANILVVEDNPANMRLTRDILEGLGYAVLAAEDAHRGISLAQERNPALILMDISLPGIDGLAATQMLKRDSRTRHIPVVALTAHAMERDRRNARSAGCVDYITKPIELKSFRQTVRQWVGAPPEAEAAGKTPTILIVDDEPQNRQLLAAMVGSLGWQAEAAANGFEALSNLHSGVDLDCWT